MYGLGDGDEVWCCVEQGVIYVEQYCFELYVFYVFCWVWIMQLMLMLLVSLQCLVSGLQVRLMMFLILRLVLCDQVLSFDGWMNLWKLWVLCGSNWRMYFVLIIVNRQVLGLWLMVERNICLFGLIRWWQVWIIEVGFGMCLSIFRQVIMLNCLGIFLVICLVVICWQLMVMLDFSWCRCVIVSGVLFMLMLVMLVLCWVMVLLRMLLL